MASRRTPIPDPIESLRQRAYPKCDRCGRRATLRPAIHVLMSDSEFEKAMQDTGQWCERHRPLGPCHTITELVALTFDEARALLRAIDRRIEENRGL